MSQMKMQKKRPLLRLLKKVLLVMAKVTLLVHRPFVVGVTGSVGKTSTKDAIIQVLSGSYTVRGPRGNHNNEIGVPLTVIGLDTAGSSFVGWLRVGFRWMSGLFQSYPDVLVLEYGIDRPGDMDALLAIIKPNVAVYTHVSYAHVEFFDDLAGVDREKSKLVAGAVPAQRDPDIAGVVLNADVGRVAKAQRLTDLPVTTFSNKEHDDSAVDLFSSGVHINVVDGVCNGLSFKANISGKSVPIRLEHVIARHHVNAALAAIAVGTIFNIHLVDMAQQLADYMPPAGRMRLLPGKGGVHIIDDTYNASPDAVLAALATLREFPSRETVAVLGDMLELGAKESGLHEKVLKRAVKEKISRIVLVGRRMSTSQNILEDAGYLSGETFISADGPEDVIAWITKNTKAGDAVLIKGSQAMRMEKITEALVADTVDHKTSLPRQSKDWKQKSYQQP